MGQLPLAQARHYLPNPLFAYLEALHDHIELLAEFRMRAPPLAKNPAFQKVIEKIHRILLLVTDDLIRNLRRHIRFVPEMVVHLQRQIDFDHYPLSERANAFRFKQAALAVRYDMLQLVWMTTFDRIEILRREKNPPAKIKNFNF